MNETPERDHRADGAQLEPDLRSLAADLGASAPLPARDPGFVREVLARTEQPERRPRLWLPVAATAAVATLAVIVFVGVGPRDPAADFTARGKDAVASALVGFEAYSHAEQGAAGVAIAAGARLEPGASLSFDVLNHTERDVQLMLFGVDAAQQVHWFYPAWLDADAPPSSVAVAATTRRVPLREAVEPEALAPGSFMLVGWFSEHSYDVTRVEATLAAGGVAALERLPGHLGLQRLPLEVAR